MHDLVVSIVDILGRPGHYRDVSVAHAIEGGLELAALTDRPVRASLRLESVVEGILATGKVQAETRLTCARCLNPFTAGLDVDVCELFGSPSADVESRDDFYTD